MNWVAYDLTSPMRGAFLGGQLGEPPWDNPWFVEQGRRDFTRCIGLVEHELAARGGPHIAGAGFTLADIPLGLVVNRWFCVQGFAKPDFPAVAAYYDRLTERPGYRMHGRNGLP
jgi:glutathione S-transferase